MTHDGNGIKQSIHRMVIILNETTGQFRVEGIPDTKVTALGMIKLAEHAIVSQTPQAKSPITQLPPGVRLG
jgi:hypothetical protein